MHILKLGMDSARMKVPILLCAIFLLDSLACEPLHLQAPYPTLPILALFRFGLVESSLGNAGG